MKRIILFALASSLSFFVLADPQIDQLKSQADSGNINAALKIGMAYDYGVTGLVNQDKKEALKYYQIAYNGGSEKAASLMGVFYYKQKNQKEAIKYLKEGVQKKEYLSFAYFGKIFEDAKLQDKATYYYRIAAENGIPEAQYDYARFYEEGLGGLNKDPILAYTWYRMANDKGFKNAADKVSFFDTQLTKEQKLLAQKAMLKYKK